MGVSTDFVDYRITKPAPTNLGEYWNTLGETRTNEAYQFTLIESAPTTAEAVEHPAHYGGKDNPYEVIKVAEAWGLDKDAYLFNVLKYVARAGKKGAVLEDLKKGAFYLNRKVKNVEGAK